LRLGDDPELILQPLALSAGPNLNVAFKRVAKIGAVGGMEIITGVDRRRRCRTNRMSAVLLSWVAAHVRIERGLLGWAGASTHRGRAMRKGGTPKQVIAKLRVLLEETRLGILAFWGNNGTVSHQDAKTCIRLLGQEVFPAVREMAKEFDLKSPFETNQPVSTRYMNGLERAVAE
jgi:hypothetical protein